MNTTQIYESFLKDPYTPVKSETSTPNTVKHIYRITNQVNGKVYIGQSTEPEKRFVAHMKTIDSKSTTRFTQSIRHHGVDAYSMEVIFTTTEEYSNFHEIRLIAENNSYCHDQNSNGYNMTRGGSYIDSGTCSLMTKERTAAGLNPFSTSNGGSELSKKTNKIRLEKGTHNYVSQEHRQHVSEVQNKMVSDGAHQWQTEKHRKDTSENQLKRIVDGTHHILSTKYRRNSSVLAKQAVVNGTSNLTNFRTCNVCGFCGKGAVMTRWHFENCGKIKETWNDGVKNFTVYEGEDVKPNWTRGMRK